MGNLNRGNVGTCPFFCIPLAHLVEVTEAFAALAMPLLAWTGEGSCEMPISAAQETPWLTTQVQKHSHSLS